MIAIGPGAATNKKYKQTRREISKKSEKGRGAIHSATCRRFGQRSNGGNRIAECLIGGANLGRTRPRPIPDRASQAAAEGCGRTHREAAHQHRTATQRLSSTGCSNPKRASRYRKQQPGRAWDSEATREGKRRFVTGTAAGRSPARDAQTRPAPQRSERLQARARNKQEMGQTHRRSDAEQGAQR